MSQIKLSQQLRQLSQELTAAEHAGDEEEAERLRDLIAEVQEEMEAEELDGIDERRHKGYR